MPALAAKLSVIAAAAMTLWTGIEAVRVRHARPNVAPLPIDDVRDREAVTVPQMVVAPDFAPMRVEPPSPPAPSAIDDFAHIHGQVVGGQPSQQPVTVTVEGSEQRYEAQVENDGRFEISLPAGSYRIVATRDSEVAEAVVAGLRQGEDREVNLLLGEGATITGTVRRPDGDSHGIAVTLHRAKGGSREQAVELDKAGGVSFTGLLPSQVYDLNVTADGMRPLVMRQLTAPRRLDLVLEPKPVLRGGFGLAVGEDCPLTEVRVVGTDGEVGASFDSVCAFAVEDLPSGQILRVRAMGGGRHLETDVAVPEHGSPPFVCLRQPCAMDEPLPKASVHYMRWGAAGGMWWLSVVASGEYKHQACDPGSDTCVLEALPVDPEASVAVYGGGCRTVQMYLGLVAGANYVAAPCERIEDMMEITEDVAEEGNDEGSDESIVTVK